MFKIVVFRVKVSAGVCQGVGTNFAVLQGQTLQTGSQHHGNLHLLCGLPWDCQVLSRSESPSLVCVSPSLVSEAPARGNPELSVKAHQVYAGLRDCSRGWASSTRC